MSIDDDDLDEAVRAGVLTRAQVDALQVFVGKRRETLLEQAGQEDERFRFMRGFNDFFFAIGILLLCSAMAFFAGFQALPNLAAAVVVWLLSELLVRRMRLVLPGILLSVFFLFFVFAAAPVEYLLHLPPLAQRSGLSEFSPFDMKPGFLARSLIAVAASGLYYWRFRLPFALATLAAAALAAVLSLVGLVAGPLSKDATHAVMLACGITIFAAAMAFDLSDRMRVTRRSDCAFWLHLLAAPLIVHSLISFVIPDMTALDARSAVLILVIVAVLALVAIIVDRRALLVSTLAYIGIVIAFALSSTGSGILSQRGSGALVFFVTLFILGLFVIVLGLGWQPVRRAAVAALPTALVRRLAPLPTRA